MDSGPCPTTPTKCAQRGHLKAVRLKIFGSAFWRYSADFDPQDSHRTPGPGLEPFVVGPHPNRRGPDPGSYFSGRDIQIHRAQLGYAQAVWLRLAWPVFPEIFR